MSAFVGYRVLVVDRVSGRFLEGLREAGLEVEYRPGIPRDVLLEIIKGFDVLVFRGSIVVDREVIDRGLRLRVLARYGVGLDNVDVDYAVSRGIAVVNAPTASSQSVAELTIGLIIVALRSLHLHIDSVKRGVWSKGLYKGRELCGKKLGVIGFGRIGSRVARLAAAIGARVLAYDVRDVREAVESVGGELVDLEDLLVESDIVTLHVPLTPSTYRMMDECRLRLLKDGAILVNTSRGPVVDYEALLKHIERLGAVALDVLDEEPPRSPILRKLIEHPKVIVTPHIGAETIEAMERVGEELLAGILEVLGVETPNPRARSAT